MTRASEIGVGTVLGETYRVTALLGEGGMGAVWAAEHLRLPGKRVAIKVLLGATDHELYTRFRREAEIASRIGHPNIVTVHDFNALPAGTPYLVLELLEGEDLAQRLARGPLELTAALAIARQIGSALQAAHRAEVVHRDLKPGNIFLVPTEVGGEAIDQVKVLDFGISKIRGSKTVQTQDAVLLGTPQYMAPEQALGQNAAIDARTDLFAFGAIVYEMLSGQPAFAGSNLAEVVFKVVYQEPPALATLAPTTPATVVAAVERALAKDPAQRFGDVTAFVQALTGRPLSTRERPSAGQTAALAPTFAAPAPAPPSPPAASAAGSPAAHAFTVAAPSSAQASSPPAGATGLASTVAAAAQAATGPVSAPAASGLETPPVPPAASAPRGGRWWLAAAALLFAGTGAGLWLARARAPSRTASVPVAAPAMPPAAPALAAPAKEAPAPGAHSKEDPAPAHSQEAPARAHSKEAHAPTAQVRSVAPARPSPRERALPPAVTADLEVAERLIETRGDEAIRLARRSLLTRKTSRAFSIIARAYCRAGNLGDAQAALHSVSGAERPQVLRYCKAAGTALR